MNSPPTFVCLSANPAMDRRLRLPLLQLGGVNRASSAQGLPGGKAAHVAMAGRALGAHAVWIGLLGGASGQECAEGLRRMGIEVIAVRTAASTRLNLEIIEESGQVTEILEPGAQVEEDACGRMVASCGEALAKFGGEAMVAISGSLPAGMAAECCAEMVKRGRQNGNGVLLDSSGEALRAGLEAGPDLAKPNRAEAEALLGRTLDSISEFAEGARELVRRGARSAAITMGAAGMVWAESAAGAVWLARPPEMEASSTVGCGDATLAGFAWGLARKQSGEDCIRLAAACGAANCVAALPGQISLETVGSLQAQVHVEKIA